MACARYSRRGVILAPLLLTINAVAPLPAQSTPTARIVAAVPELRTFDLVLNEIWLERAPIGSHAIASATDAPTPEALLVQLHALETANPGSEASLVLYEVGAARDDAHRLLLTREVAVLTDGRPSPMLVKLHAVPLAAVPGAYVVRAPDPWQSIALAGQLRSQPGVRAAYPLLRRSAVPR